MCCPPPSPLEAAATHLHTENLTLRPTGRWRQDLLRMMWLVIAVRSPLFISLSSSGECSKYDWKYEFASHSNLQIMCTGKLWPFSQRWIIQKSWIQLKQFLIRAHSAPARWLDTAESPCTGTAEVRHRRGDWAASVACDDDWQMRCLDFSKSHCSASVWSGFRD